MAATLTSSSAQAQPRTLSHLLQAHAGTGTGGAVMLHSAAAAAVGGSSASEPESLSDLLNKSKKDPSTTSIAAVPSGGLSDNEIQQLSNIQLLTSFVSVEAAKLYYTRSGGVAPDITNPATALQYNKDMANINFEVVTKSLPGFLNMEKAVAYDYHKSQTSAEFHAEFLGELFKAFAFPEATLTELDAILTSVTKALSDLRFSFTEQSETLDHLVFFYYFEAVPGLDVKVAKMRLFNLQLKSSSWQAVVSTGKSRASVDHIQFDMNYYDYACTMSNEQVQRQKGDIQDLITKMTGNAHALFHARTHCFTHARTVSRTHACMHRDTSTRHPRAWHLCTRVLWALALHTAYHG